MQKSSKVKLRLVSATQWGQIVILPMVGETEISEDGSFTIDDVVATLLLNKTDSYLLIEGNGTTVTAENHPGKIDKESKDYVEPTEETEETEETEQVEEVEEPTEVEVEPEIDEEVDELKDKTLSELLAIAKEADIPSDEYKKFKKSKKLMYNFLKKYAAD